MGDQQTPEERLADLERREHALRTDRVRFELTQALAGANCRAEGLEDATTLMASLVAPEFDDDGRVTKLSIAGGQSFETPADAAKAFLESRAYYLAAEQPVAGARSPEKRSLVAAEQGIVRAFERSPAAPKPAAAPKLPKGSLEELLQKGYSAGDLAAEGWAEPPKAG